MQPSPLSTSASLMCLSCASLAVAAAARLLKPRFAHTCVDACPQPPFKACCPWLQQQANLWSDQFRFVVVYIEEAHAADEWPVGALTSVTEQPKTLEHRIELARRVHASPELLNRSAKVEVLCDTMSNRFQDTMACWPIRFFVLDPVSGVLQFKAQPDLSPDVYGYPLHSLSDWLTNNARALSNATHV
jgi:hypothetical protein